MKNKILIILLFIVLAFPLPIALLGSLMSFLWFLSSIMKGSSVIEIVMAIIGTIIGATYILTYVISLIKTWNEKKISFKTFIPLAHCLIALVYLLSLVPVGNYLVQSKEYFGFAKKEFSVVEELDTHGGFLGDGSYYLILDCSDNREEALEKVKGWNKLPLSENLHLIMYGGEKDGRTYGFELAEEAKMPKIENGYYIFEDRNFESKDSRDDSELFNRYSYNFSIAVYDMDTDRMYYFEYDT